MQERRAHERRRLNDSRTIVAEMLLDVAAFQKEETGVELSDWKERQKALEGTLRETVLKREHEAQAALLETWGFKFGALDREALVVDDDSKDRDDLFDDDDEDEDDDDDDLPFGGGEDETEILRKLFQRKKSS